MCCHHPDDDGGPAQQTKALVNISKLRQPKNNEALPLQQKAAQQCEGKPCRPDQDPAWSINNVGWQAHA
jgi:hypothetical protein